MLVTDASIRMSRLRWLATGPVEASAAAVRNEVEKLGFVRGLGADALDLSVLPAERRRFLAMLGRRLTPQALERRDPERRYPILLTVLAQSGTDVLDEVVALFDQEQARSPELKRNLIAVLLAYSTNLGLMRMAEASGISYDILAWTSEWYVREETLRAANLAIIGYHQRLPLTMVFGTGTLSSSDGQRFPTRGKSTTARAVNLWFAEEGLSTYTHVTDQHTTYGTKVIVTTRREAHYVLDEILGNATDLPITEHATDTHRVTLVNFALFDLLGMQLSPCIRDLGKITLHRPVPRAEADMRFPHAEPLLTRKLNLDLIAEHYDDLIRLAGSLKFGHATASLLVGKLSASGRQNALAAALKEYGAMRRTIYACRYLTDPDYRRRISRQLNKGESIHALKRGLIYAHEGAFRARHPEAQTEQAWCLTLATNAVIAWTTDRGRADTPSGPPHRCRCAGSHLACAQREHQLLRRDRVLRRDRGRYRRRARRARSDRVPAAAGLRHPVLIAARGPRVRLRCGRAATRRRVLRRDCGSRRGLHTPSTAWCCGKPSTWAERPPCFARRSIRCSTRTWHGCRRSYAPHIGIDGHYGFYLPDLGGTRRYVIPTPATNECRCRCRWRYEVVDAEEPHHRVAAGRARRRGRP